jgi:hypothetical protein
MKFKRRSLYPIGKSGKLHLSLRVGSSLKIEPAHSTKAILDMNLDRRSVDGLFVSALNCKLEGTWACTALNDGNLLTGRLCPTFRKQKDCDEDGAQSTKYAVHSLTIIQTTGNAIRWERRLEESRSIIRQNYKNSGQLVDGAKPKPHRVTAPLLSALLKSNNGGP